ncbi:hypothetical protein ACJZ2D_001736 [Fusarium nematophilum]
MRRQSGVPGPISKVSGRRPRPLRMPGNPPPPGVDHRGPARLGLDMPDSRLNAALPCCHSQNCPPRGHLDGGSLKRRLDFSGFLLRISFNARPSFSSSASGMASLHDPSYDTESQRGTILSVTITFACVFYAAIVLYNLGMNIVKISFLLFYRRIFPEDHMRKICIGLLIFVGLWTITQILTLCLSCLPLTVIVPSMHGHCLDTMPVWFFSAAMSIITDFIIFLVPLPSVAKLNLPVKQKVALLALFCLGFFTCTISVIRIFTLKAAIETTDPTYDLSSAAMWSAAELSISIIIASLPTLRPLVHHFSAVYSSTFSGDSYQMSGFSSTPLQSLKPYKLKGQGSRDGDRDVLDYPTDIKTHAEHLKLPSYYILGTSGGTGFTLACTKDLARSGLKAVGICAGIGPHECGFDSMAETQRKALEAWKNYPDEFRESYETEYVPLVQQKDTVALMNRLRGEIEAGFKGRDREAMLQEDTLRIAASSLRQAWIQGAWAHAKGMGIHWRPWGFKVDDVGFPGIKLWYGGSDVSTTPKMGKYMAERLKGSVYKEFLEDSLDTIWREGNAGDGAKSFRRVVGLEYEKL